MKFSRLRVALLVSLLFGLFSAESIKAKEYKEDIIGLGSEEMTLLGGDLDLTGKDDDLKAKEYKEDIIGLRLRRNDTLRGRPRSYRER